MPGPKSGVHGLKCIDREGDGVHQSCAAVPSAYLALVAYVVILPGRLGVSDVDVFPGLCPCLFGWWSFSPLVGVSPCSSCRSLLSLFPVDLAALLVFFSWLSRWFRGRPGRAAVLVSPLSASFVLGILSFGVHDFGIFADFDVVAYFVRFFAAFSELRGARQVDRLADCSFRHLPPVVFFILAGSLGVFSDLRSSRSWRLLRGGALHRLR